ncbi:unnamed protein product [Rotaria socialis]|uniref:C2H2-type domain-containing protein n=2 Tax=Rotaria socialis TaxID=392032 RepID=A0A821IE43_9BILA|nr:unnamed protein product [Rotaria socialis]
MICDQIGIQLLTRDYSEVQKGCLGKTNVPNISTIRPIEYNTKCMKVFKASNIGKDASVPYKNIDFSTNMRLTSAFTVPINDEDHAIVSKKISDRAHRLFFMCPLSGCTSTFESSADLDLHISTNLHKVPPQNPRTSNDIARRWVWGWDGFFLVFSLDLISHDILELVDDVILVLDVEVAKMRR